MPLYRGELPEWHPTFPVGSDAASKAANTPVGIDTPKLVYTAEDDAAIDEFHRNRGTVSLLFSFMLTTTNH
jgi:alcohol oxidase